MRHVLAALLLSGLISAAPCQEQAPLTALAERLDGAPSPDGRAALVSTPTPELLALCFERATAFSAKFDQDAALKSYRSALAVATALHDPIQSARAWRGIGIMLNRQGRFTESIDAYRSGFALLPPSALKPRADLLRSMGVGLRALGNFSEAVAVDEQALAVFRELKDDAGIFTTLNGIGGSYARLGDLHKAADLF